VPTLTEAGQRGRIDLMSFGSEQACDALPTPTAMTATVNEDKGFTHGKTLAAHGTRSEVKGTLPRSSPRIGPARKRMVLNQPLVATRGNQPLMGYGWINDPLAVSASTTTATGSRADSTGRRNT
jgi:hypothetical protein